MRARAGKGRFWYVVATSLALAVHAVNIDVPPAQASTTISALTFNLAMGNDSYEFEEDTQAIVLWHTISASPWAVSLQEVCFTQFNWLNASIAAHGKTYVGGYRSTRTPTAAGCDGSRGNAVFGAGTAGPGETTITHQMLPNGGTENRWAVCRKFHRSEGTFTACSAHMGLTALGRQHANDAFHWWAATHTTPWFFGGDFNHMYGEVDAASGHSPTAEWFYTHEEIHLPLEPETLDGSGKKIDFMFADRGAFDDGPSSTCGATAFSDHRYCLGFFTR